jgi:phosphatidylethanolamine-binding protein (PEBP) family uncharacterized protein
MSVARLWASFASLVTCLLVAIVLAGCGEGSNKSASVGTTSTTATAAATPTTSTSTTPSTTSTAAKPPVSKSDKRSSTTHAKTTATPSKPAGKALTKSRQTSPEQKNGFEAIKVTSTAFKAGGPISVQYTCDGAGDSPPLEWHGVPHGAAEVLMLAIDLSGSAGEATQWAVAGIPASATSIPAGGLPAGAVAGVNSSGKVGWSGVCGAKGQQQRVVFLFYALSRKLGLKSGFNPNEARGELRSVTLATGLTLATYKRS